MNSGINLSFEKYKSEVDKIAQQYDYDSNIKHLLWIIITAFVVKYGMKRENVILDCFRSTRIIVRDFDSKNVYAFFDRDFLYRDGYKVQKYVVINSNVYENYAVYLDTIIHEFNHAINSMINDTKIIDDKLYLRTGISYAIYNKERSMDFEGKTNEYVLEEIINTRQTEEIMNIILELKYLSVDDTEMSNFLHSISSEVNNDKYKSNAYRFQSYICKGLMDNKTFFSTMEALRFEGDIESIVGWFDTIAGESGSYSKLNDALCSILELEQKYSSRKMFRGGIVRKIRKYNLVVEDIINTFNNNCTYK